MTTVDLGDFKVLERLTPIAQLLEEWGDENRKEELDLKAPKAIFESMAKTLWDVYSCISEKLDDLDLELSRIKKGIKKPD